MGWTSLDLSGHGNHTTLIPGALLVQDDPVPNPSCVWAFIAGSTFYYACGGYPLQAAVPYVNALGQYVHNEIWSPSIPLAGTGDAVEVSFDVYEDLPLDNLVFYYWKVRVMTGGVWGAWATDDIYHYGGSKLWDTFRTPSVLVPPGSTAVQVALGCIDNCADWCGVYGTGACHSHAPLLDEVKVFRLFTGPAITSITDVGNDQGRRVRIVWDRSPWDTETSLDPITGYGVYRRQDAFLAAAPSPGARQLPAPPGVDRSLLDAGWDYVLTVPARAVPVYQTIVETLCDSTVAAGQCWSVFMVSAMTASPSRFYDSWPDSGYSVDNLSPPPPAAFTVAYNAPGGNALHWAESTAPDFHHFNVYRTGGPGTLLAAASGTLVFSTADNEWLDAGGTTQHQYTIGAVDVSGNESAVVGPILVTGIGQRTPQQFALHPGVPNPFNASTDLQYAVPAGGGRVALRVYDAAGRLVAVLRDGHETPGEKSVGWDGRDSNGRRVASGVYFCRMTAPGFSMSRKLVVMR